MAATPKAEKQPVTAMVTRQATPDDMIFAGIKANVPIETLERLYALKQKYEADEAEKAYVDAMAEFKKNPPEILKKTLVDYELKTGGRTTYMHADLGEVCEKIVAGLADHGFSHDWETRQEGGLIYVTCVITHRLKHSKRFPMPGVAPDTSGGKNAIQGVASAMTYMQRYSLMSATGLAAKGMDNDGRGDPGADATEYLTDHEQVIVNEWIETAKVTKSRFLEWLKVERVADLPRSEFHKALNQLKSIAKQKGIE